MLQDDTQVQSNEYCVGTFRKPKTYCGVNTDGTDSDNKMLSALFFDDALLTNSLVNGNASCRLLLTRAIVSDLHLNAKQHKMDETSQFKHQKTIYDI